MEEKLREIFAGFFGRFTGKARRVWLCLFRPGYVKKAVERREGSCNQCGNCCKIAFSCPFLKVYGSHSLCRIYHIGRPSPCVAFPINHQDLADVGFECTFTFPAEQHSSQPNKIELPVWNVPPISFSPSPEDARGDGKVSPLYPFQKPEEQRG